MRGRSLQPEKRKTNKTRQSQPAKIAAAIAAAIFFSQPAYKTVDYS